MYSFRKINTHDHVACSALHQLCSSSFWSSGEYTQLLKVAQGIGSFRDSELIGMILYQGTAVYVDIVYIGVSPCYRRMGIGRSLLEEVICSYPQAEIFVEVDVNNRGALNLYHQMHFACIGERKNYYRIKNYSADAVVLKKSS